MVLQTVSSPFIVKLFGTFQDQASLYFVLEYLPYGDLAKVIATKRPFSEEIIKIITANIIMGLEDLRTWGIIHWDLKPENLIINSEGHLVFVDFGTCDIVSVGDIN